MTVLAKYVFSSLALSARLHGLLDILGQKHSQRGFESHLEQALQSLDATSPLRQEARTEVLSLLRREFDELQRRYALITQTTKVPHEHAGRLSSAFNRVEEKLRQKEVML